MEPKLLPILKKIYDLERQFGNKIVRVINFPTASCVATCIVFEQPLHRKEVESTIDVSKIRWSSGEQSQSYACVGEGVSQTIMGPMPSLDGIIPEVMGKISDNLKRIVELELKLGNEIADIREVAEYSWLSIVFRRVLHKKEIESSLSLPESVTYWENHDAHYPLEAGYKCGEANHHVAGPLDNGKQ